MQKNITTILFAICLTLTLPMLVRATIISEIEANDTLNTAQKLYRGNFSNHLNPDIFDSENIPWVSITSASPASTSNHTNSYDYYSFTVVAGTTGYFDIDYGFTGQQTAGSTDTYLTLLNSIGVVLEGRDDGSDGFQSNEDPGSIKYIDSKGTWFLDPSFAYTFTQDGTYYLKVSLWDGLALAQGDTYTLQVSLDPAPVPEPTTFLLVGTGLTAFVSSRIRRKRKH